MTDITGELFFDTAAVLSFNDGDGGPREVTALILPWNQVGKGVEFAPGSVEIPENVRRVKLIDSHRKDSIHNVVAFAVSAESREEGIVARFRFDSSPEADRAWLKLDEGTIDGFSVGLAQAGDVDAERTDRGSLRIKSGFALKETSLTSIPAMDDARALAFADAIASTYMKEITLTDDNTSTATATPTVVLSEDFAVQLGEALEQGFSRQTESLGEILTRVANPQAGEVVPAAAPAPIAQVKARPVYGFGAGDSHSFIKDQWYLSGRSYAPEAQDDNVLREARERVNTFMGEKETQWEREVRLGVTDMMEFDTATTSNAAELKPTRIRQDLYVPNLSFETPLWDAFSHGTLTDITAFTLPKFLAASGLSADHVETTNPTPGYLRFTTQTVTPKAISGSFKGSREIFDAATPQLDQIALAEMERERLEDREAYLYALLSGLALATLGATGTALSSGGAGANLIDELKAQLIAANFRRGGNRMNRAVSGQTAFTAVANAKDDVNRPLLPRIAPQNADGTVDRSLIAYDIDGMVVRGAWPVAATRTYLFASQSLWAWESGVRQFRFEEKDGPANIELAHFSYAAAACIRPTDVVYVLYS